LKIIQVMAGADHGGAETAFVDMCVALKQAGENVVVATRANNDSRIKQLKDAGIPVHTMRFGGVLDFFTRAQLTRVIRDFKPEIVQTWMSRAAQKTPRWRKSMDVPHYQVLSRLGGYYKLKNFKETDYFATITPDIGKFLIDQGVKPGRVRHINNFAETENPSAPVPRASLNTPDEVPLLLTLSRLHTSKALDTLFKALAKIPGTWLWLAGEGPEREALEELARELKIDDRVRFLGWRNDRAALLRAVDVCVFPSRYEPFGTVFVQAWANKKPLVVSTADGPRQYVRDGQDSLVFPIDDVDALAAALKRVLTDRPLAAELVENGYRRYQNEFTKEKTVEAYLDYYREITKT